MAAAVPAMLSPSSGLPGRLLRLIAIGTVPAVIVGLLFNDVIETSLRSPAVAAAALAAGALLMLIAERAGEHRRDETTLGVMDAVLIGAAQACALVPGVSRSGATITMGLFLGVRRDAGARFTFLLAIPAILAAGGKEALELRHAGVDAQMLSLFLMGTAVSAGVGYLTIKYFLRFLAGHRLDVFAYYRLALAAAAVIWLLR